MKHLVFRLRIDPETITELDSVDLFLRSCLPSLSLHQTRTRCRSFLALALATGRRAGGL
jgi:hypothetical protein